MAHDTQPQLPVIISGPSDVGRLIRELETINESMLQLGLRKSGKEVKLPKTSLLLDKVAEATKLNLLQAADRQNLLQFLKAVRQSAPVLHVSFNADPSPVFMQKLVAWLRKEIHPQTLVTVGLQPNLGAGCIVRTANRQFDFSLRRHFAKKRDLLVSKLVQEAAA